MKVVLVGVTVVVAALSVSIPAESASSFHTHVDWTDGHFLVGVPRTGTVADAIVQGGPASGVTFARLDVPVDPCHRRVELDLHYEPRGADVGTDDVGATVPYRFNVTFEGPEGAIHRSFDLDTPRDNIPLGTVPAAAVYGLELRLVLGADVDWSVRVQGWAVPNEPMCGLWLNEAELNPAGLDAGAEWIELYNDGDQPVDVSGWLVRGASWSAFVDDTPFTIPHGTIVGPGDHVRVDLASGEFFDDEDEVVELVHPIGAVLDRSAPISDRLDDGSTNQRVPDASGHWVLAPSTPGATNGS